MEKSGQKPRNDQEQRKEFLIDVAGMYRFTPGEMVPDIRTSAYSNLAYITCTNQDVFIDFLEMPGMKKEGRMVVPGTRIYMSHSAAQHLAGKLAEILEGTYRRGEMESYSPPPVKPPVRMKDDLRGG